MVFENTCPSCQVDSGCIFEHGDEGAEDPYTPEALIIRSQGRDLSDEQGQWTFVGNREIKTQSFSMRGIFGISEG
jgi:hypothetical protein